MSSTDEDLRVFFARLRAFGKLVAAPHPEPARILLSRLVKQIDALDAKRHLIPSRVRTAYEDAREEVLAIDEVFGDGYGARLAQREETISRQM